MNNYIPVFILKELIILPGQEIKIDITNEISKKLIKLSAKSDLDKVLVIAPRDLTEINPSIEDLPKVGVVAQIVSKLELSSGVLRVVLKGINRVRIDKYYQNRSTGILKCSYEAIELPNTQEAKEKAIRRKLIEITEEYINNDSSISNSIIKTIKSSDNLDYITDVITSFIPFNFNKKLSYMECINPLTRAENLIDDLQEEISISNIDKELNEKLQESLENGQREYILKEKLKEINNELGNFKEKEIEVLEGKVNKLKIDDKVKDKLLNEIKKYSFSSEYSPESSVLKTYLETVINLPWNESSKECSDIKEISRKLNESHYGMDEVKDRVIEYVSLASKNINLTSPIICLVGPPGVGKTTIAMSIADALNREFYKMSVGGLNDSTELVGSRKTYLAAAPGKIMQGIIKCKVNNPIILIDEVDKMVKDYKGDPASTLLEILDKSQNKYFVDNYIEEPFDLSNVFFILTANDTSLIPVTLLDRLEIINLNSYSIYEKINIAKNYLIKDILNKYNCNLKISKETIEYIVKNYTKEPGVRELNRYLDKVVRKVLIYEKDAKSVTINLANKYLGKEKINSLPKIRDYGICNVLAYTNLGGMVSHVEVAKHKGSGKLDITGQAGDVLVESVKVVVNYILSTYEVDMSESDLHVHFITASQKKDGPSAGVSIAVAMLSIIQRRLIDGSIAFTGEITLKGDILPVGGLKEKLIAASCEGITKVFIPKDNELDLLDIPQEIFENMSVKLVSNFSEIYDVLFN